MKLRCLSLLLISGLFLEITADELSFKAMLRPGQPILIAHRGGVVGEGAPECSLEAIRRASRAGFQMVELDVRRSRDGTPFVFHDRDLLKACGQSGSLEDYPAETISGFFLMPTRERIPTLEQALRLCRELALGVMFDFKSGADDQEFLERIHTLLLQAKLTSAAITFTGEPLVRDVLKGVSFTPGKAQLQSVFQGQVMDLSNAFWFGLPRHLSDAQAGQLVACGASLIPAINRFRYPGPDHMERARADVRRMMALGVDGFQIDAIYLPLFPPR
jgi:glycerophosphoryl diester phosphodiesterase